MREMVLLHIVDELSCDLAVVDEIFVLFFHPGADVHLINVDRTVKPFGTALQPFRIFPAIIAEIFDDAGRIRAQFAVKRVWIHLVHHPAGCLRDAVFIRVIDLCAFDVQAPCAAFVHLLHLMAFTFPFIE